MTDPEAARIPRAMGRIPLPPPPPHSADMIAMVEAQLDRLPVDPALLARIHAPEAVAERNAREARQRADDWANLARYRAANAGIDRPELVMIGDSLTEIWQVATPALFGERIVNRGIAGQTSPQILLRFMQDVVGLRPKRVHILCGTNDIAGNTGPNGPEDYQRNIGAMTDIATSNGIEILIGALPPAGAIFWQPDARPREWVPILNAWLEAFASARRLRYIDYHAILTDGHGALQEQWSVDGVHLTRAAYRRMNLLLAQAAGGNAAIGDTA